MPKNSLSAQYESEKSATWHLANVWHRLTTPHLSVQEPERRQAWLLSSLLVVLVPVATLLTFLRSIQFGAAVDPALDALYRTTLDTLIVLAIAYGLSRTRYYALAAMLTVSVIQLAVFVLLIIIPPSSPETALLLAYLGLGVLLSSLLLSPRLTLLTLVLTTAGMLLLPLLIPDLLWNYLFNALSFLFIVSVLAITSAMIRQQDIGRIEQQSRILAESEERLRAVMQSADEAIISTDKRWRIVAWNRGAQVLFGYAEAEVLGKPITLLMPERYVEAFNKGWQRLGSAGASAVMGKTFQWHGRRKDDSEFLGELAVVTWQVRQEFFYTAFIRDITERQRAQEAIQQAHEKLKASMYEQEQRNRELHLLGEMDDWFQACVTVEEVYKALALSAPRLFPAEAGVLFVYSPSRDDLEAVATWGEFPVSLERRTITADDCWALRRGRVHRVDDAHAGLLCAHLNAALPVSYLCVPLMAQGEALGVLHLQSKPAPPMPPGGIGEGTPEIKERLAVMMAEHMALALANLRLRETLRDQSIRDPLTSLFNRRYMEETLERELHRAKRGGTPLGIIMLDFDHFKRFNDTFGHEAGDVLLREFGALLKGHIRGGDVACRYGGEEFVLILPEAPRDATRQCAEELCVGARLMKVVHHGQLLGAITLSLGVAYYPEHGMTAQTLLRAADIALYQAKSEGCDRVVVAPPLT